MIAITPERQRTKDGHMAKKKSASANPHEPDRVHPSEVRFQTVRVDDLVQSVEDARDFLAQMESTIKFAQSREISEFVVDGATKLARALRLLEDFAGNVYKGVHKASVQRRRDQRSTGENA